MNHPIKPALSRRSLLQLSAGLIVGEPARRAYSFLNGHGLERSLYTGVDLGYPGSAVEFCIADVQRAVELLRMTKVFLAQGSLVLPVSRQWVEMILSSGSPVVMSR